MRIQEAQEMRSSPREWVGRAGSVLTEGAQTILTAVSGKVFLGLWELL